MAVLPGHPKGDRQHISGHARNIAGGWREPLAIAADNTDLRQFVQFRFKKWRVILCSIIIMFDLESGR